MTKKKQNNNSSSNVKVVDGKLILTLTNAKNPVVWQMDLEHAQSCAFTVQEDKKAKVFSLAIKNQDRDIEEIAQFDNKPDAVHILMETSTALQNGHGKIKPSTVTAGNQNTPNNDNKKGAILALALVMVLFTVWAMSISLGKNESDSSSYSRDQISSTSPSKQTSGVPVSADDFLRNR